jgi:hypothetical protein
MTSLIVLVATAGIERRGVELGVAEQNRAEWFCKLAVVAIDSSRGCHGCTTLRIRLHVFRSAVFGYARRAMFAVVVLSCCW